MVAIDVDDMLADSAGRDLIKLSQQPQAEPDGAVLQPDLYLGLAILGLVEYDACIWRSCAFSIAHVIRPLRLVYCDVEPYQPVAKREADVHGLSPPS